MEIAIIVALAIIIIAMGGSTAKTKKKQQTQDNQHETKNTDFDYSNGYKQKWMFTYNEKDAYQKLKEITDELGIYLFAKVRLFDLVEPKTGIENRKTYQNKIQAKHVDFVICDKKLVARTVIELDDSTHDTPNGITRDNFVDEVLQSCGYKVLHIRAVEPECIKTELVSIFTPLGATTK